MREQLQKEIVTILKDLGVENPNAVFDMPSRMDFGDLSTNVAMMYAKQLGDKPVSLAEEIKERLISKQIHHVSRIDVIAPGFINFFFDQRFFAKVIDNIKISEFIDIKIVSSEKSQKIFIEHTQPNPFKEFHIGHLMNNTIGESISRIIKANGAEVKTASYHGDVGLHVAKAIWGLVIFVEQVNKNLQEKWNQNLSFATILDTFEITNKEKLEGNLKFAYQYGSTHYELDEKSKKEIQEVNKKIYEHSDKKIDELYYWGRERSLDSFEKIYKKLDSHFDFHFYESETGPIGKKLVEENIGKVFEKGDEGAVIFKGENFEPKTHTRVFLNSEGLPTYEAKEVGLAEIKKEKFAYNKSITVTASEQDSFFNVVEVAIGEVFPELKGKLKHLSHGMLKLPGGKMSSRTGNIITAEALITEVQEKIKEKMKDREMSETQIGDVSEVIAIGAIKYSILRQAVGGDIIFDFDKSISFEGDSGPYLQYATVRANSLLKKAEGVVTSSDELPENWETTNLERLLERFPSVVEKAGREYAPHHIVTHLIDLAGEFNSFYAQHKIIDASDTTSPYRLALTKAFVHVMISGLDLLGIKVPDMM